LHRRASSLHMLDRFDDGLIACEQGSRLDASSGDLKAFEKLKQIIKTSAASKKAASAAPPRKTTVEHKDDLARHQSRTTKKNTMDAGQLSFMNSMLGSLSEKQQIKAFGRKIKPMPEYHLELPKHRGWPKGVDVAWAQGYLAHVYEQSRLLPHIMEVAFKQSNYEPPDEDLWKRVNGNPNRLKWLLKGQPSPGSICPEEVLGKIGYPTFLRHAFSNQAYRREILSLGTVHVAVGFVDLGVLLSSDVKDGPHGRSGPLRFVGVELSTFAVAKSLVIWQMIIQSSQSNGTARAVLQAWFSSTWDASTEAVFRIAVDVVRAHSELYEANAEVSRMLEHWAASKGVSLQAARSQWADTVSDRGSSISNLIDVNDRLDIAAYELTGDVFVKTSQLRGSICWWDCPDGTPANQTDQTFFAALDIRLVLAERSPGQSIFRAAEAYLLRRMDKITEWARAGSVVVEAKIGNVVDLVPQIAALQPWTMSWSNRANFMKSRGRARSTRTRCTLLIQ
jgi:hypothetical protein